MIWASYNLNELFKIPAATSGGVPCTYTIPPSSTLCSQANGTSVAHAVTCPITCLGGTSLQGQAAVCVNGLLYYGQSCAGIVFSSTGSSNPFLLRQGSDLNIYIPMFGLGTVVQTNSTGGLITSNYATSISQPVGQFRGEQKREKGSGRASRMKGVIYSLYYFYSFILSPALHLIFLVLLCIFLFPAPTFSLSPSPSVLLLSLSILPSSLFLPPSAHPRRRI